MLPSGVEQVVRMLPRDAERQGHTDGMELPEGLELERVTREFDERSVPAGLLSAHRVASGLWGRLVVTSGEISFVFEDGSGDGAGVEDDLEWRRTVRTGEHVVIPPGRLHHVVVTGPVTFRIEFHRPTEP
jgi:tellurite resistance-related uncharacterized protein